MHPPRVFDFRRYTQRGDPLRHSRREQIIGVGFNRYMAPRYLRVNTTQTYVRDKTSATLISSREDKTRR